MQLEQRVEGARGAEALGTGGRLCQMCWQQDCAGEGQHSSLAIQSLPLGTAVTTAAFFAYCSQERPVRFIFFWPNMQKSYITSLQAEGMPQIMIPHSLNAQLCTQFSTEWAEMKWKYKQPHRIYPPTPKKKISNKQTKPKTTNQPNPTLLKEKRNFVRSKKNPKPHKIQIQTHWEDLV